MSKRASSQLITVISIFSRGLYLLLFILIGNTYGSSDITDDFFLLFAPVAVLITVVAGVSEVIIMPAIHRSDEINFSYRFIRKIVRYFLLSITLASIIILPVYAFFNEKLEYLTLCLLIPIPMMATVSSILANYLNARSEFLQAALNPSYAAIASGFVFLVLPLSLTSLIFTFMSYELVRLLYLSARSIKHLKADKALNSESKEADDFLKKTLHSSYLQAVGSLLVGVNPLVDILFAKSLSSGSISSVEYANRIWNIIPLLFIGNLMLAHSRFSKAAAAGVLSLTKVHSVALSIGVWGFLASIVAIMFSGFAVNGLYGFGVMTTSDRSILSSLLSFYFLGAAPFIISLVYVRAFSALDRIKPITVSAIFSIVANLLLNYILIIFLGLNGIGLATSITYLLVAVFLAAWFFRTQRYYE